MPKTSVSTSTKDTKASKATKTKKGAKDSNDTRVGKNHPFAGINATVESVSEGMKVLTDLICSWVGTLAIEPKLRAEIARLLQDDYIWLFPLFNTKDDGKVVEAWGQFWAYRNGKLLWSLKIIWDCDGPTKTKDGKQDILPHYGYEIYFNNQRLKPPGPGHVYITSEIFGYFRDTKPMREIKKGIYAGQEFVGTGDSQVRLDHAMRLWGLGVDCELFNEDHLGCSPQEYYEVVYKAPKAWKLFDMPSFGRSEDGFEHRLDVAFDKLSKEEQSAWRADLAMYLMGEDGLAALKALDDE